MDVGLCYVCIDHCHHISLVKVHHRIQPIHHVAETSYVDNLNHDTKRYTSWLLNF